jgi:nucleoid DNA-binding protein
LTVLEKVVPESMKNQLFFLFADFVSLRYYYIIMEEVHREPLPREIEEHLRKLAETMEQTDPQSIFIRLCDAWTEKEELFSAQTQALDMELVQTLEHEDPRGAMILTSSGSLLSLSPKAKTGRWMEYAGLHIRTDVPDLLKGEGVRLEEDLVVGSSAVLEDAPVRKTSPVYKIAVCSSGTSPAEQEKRIREATIFLTNGFVRINKSVEAVKPGAIEHFTKQTMVAYVAKRNDLTQKEVKDVIEDFLTMVESGILLGERVSLGNLGRVGYKVRPPQKARVMTNPSTGEEITVPAKPSRAVVKFSVSGALKKRAENIQVEDPSA